MAAETFRFESFELDTGSYQLRSDGEPVQLEPRVFDVLVHLVRHRDRVVTKEELLDSVWGDRFVSEAALTTALRIARRAVGDSGSEQRLLRTVHRRGYQFIAPVSTTGSAAIGADHQHIRFCQADDGARIAYATVGSGPPLLKVANWMSHLDLEWSTPVWLHWLQGLAQGRELIRYDERGCGLSDWNVPSFTFDDWVTDLETVAAATGIERFPLLGVSQGGAVAVAYAVRHPERVSRLILAGAYARGRMVRAQDDAERDAALLDLELARVGWARQDSSYLQVFASQFLPDATPEEREDFLAFHRATTSVENAVRFLEVFAHIDVADIAHLVQCPTLILHSRDDVRVPAAQAAELTALIPDSELVLLDSGNHLLSAAEPAWPEFLDRIDTFLGD